MLFVRIVGAAFARRKKEDATIRTADPLRRVDVHRALIEHLFR